jgi:hypothetical protein
MKRHSFSKLKNRFSIMKRFEQLIRENQQLIEVRVNNEFLKRGKDEAMADYIEERIKMYNAAIRSTNGTKPGETRSEYQSRLVRANTPVKK